MDAATRGSAGGGRAGCLLPRRSGSGSVIRRPVLAALLGLLSACAGPDGGGPGRGGLAACARPPSVFVSREYVVVFGAGSAAVTAQGRATIKEAAAALRETTAFTVELEGLADPAEARPAPRTLAYARAVAVRSALLAEGIPEGTITPRGVGAGLAPVRAGTGAADAPRHVRVVITGSVSGRDVRPDCRSVAETPA